MPLKKNVGENADHKFEKYVPKLKEPAQRSKLALQDTLEKKIKRFQEEAKNSDSEDKKSLYLRKEKSLASDLDMLKVFSEDEIIRYAFLMLNKIMSIASNPRVPREERMKARVAAHKPLSTHLRQLKQKLCESEESESESENEQNRSISTLDKITFNKTVVLMRKDVKRAKVHVISKLTRYIKKLRLAKGKEENILKNQRKATRLHSKIIHIKELLDDDVSKFALSTTQNLNKLANDVKAPATSQAMATIAIHKLVAAHVNDFRTKYADWQKIVPVLLKKKKKKRKLNLETKDNINNSNKLAEENAESVDDQSESENDEENGKVENSENVQESDVSENGTEEESETYGHRAFKDKNAKDNVSDKVSSSRNNEVNNIKKENSKETKWLVENSRVEPNRILSKKINKDEKRMKKPSTNSLQVSTKPKEDEPKMTDPFFVTTTNEEYVTSQVPLSSETHSSSRKIEHFGNPNKPERSKFEYNNSWDRKGREERSKFDNNNKWERKGREGTYGRSSRFQESAPYKKQSSGSFDKYSANTRTDKIIFGNRKERRKALLQPQVEEKVEKLHPSWEAKKKQSIMIPFQGKKVTFD